MVASALGLATCEPPSCIPFASLELDNASFTVHACCLGTEDALVTEFVRKTFARATMPATRPTPIFVGSLGWGKCSKYGIMANKYEYNYNWGAMTTGILQFPLPLALVFADERGSLLRNVTSVLTNPATAPTGARDMSSVPPAPPPPAPAPPSSTASLRHGAAVIYFILAVIYFIL